MKITYDKIADALYISLKKGQVKRTVEMREAIIVDLDGKGKPLGIEILGASSQISKRDIQNLMKGNIPAFV